MLGLASFDPDGLALERVEPFLYRLGQCLDMAWRRARCDDEPVGDLNEAGHFEEHHLLALLGIDRFCGGLGKEPALEITHSDGPDLLIRIWGVIIVTPVLSAGSLA